MTLIRKAISSDAFGIAKVHINSWKSTYKGLISDEYLSTLSLKTKERQWLDKLSTPNVDIFTFVAENDVGKLIGFVTGGLVQYKGQNQAFMEEKFKGELMAIYLLEPFQRRGIGHELTYKLMNELMVHGVNTMITWVLKGNSAAEFYKSLGGNYIGERTIDIGNERYVEYAYGWDNLTRVILV